MLCGSEQEQRNIAAQSSLRPGSYFGEISLIYGCNTTARVTAIKYCTLARLSHQNFLKVSQVVPQFLEFLKLGIQDYNDSLLKFIKRSLLRVPYFRGLASDLILDIIFSLETEKREKDEILQSYGDDATKLIFL